MIPLAYLVVAFISYLIFELFDVAFVTNNYTIYSCIAAFFWPLAWVLILWSIILYIKQKPSGEQ